MTSRPLAMSLIAAFAATLLFPTQTASAQQTPPPPFQVIAPGEHLETKPVFVLPVADYRLTARFGATGLWSHAHTGLDFAAPEGTPIHSVAAGTVTSVGFDGSYGNKTVITLEDGTELWYAHQSEIEVSVGEHVSPGQQIGLIGSTGNVTGPHVHLEVRPGDEPIDPYPWLVEHGLQP